MGMTDVLSSQSSTLNQDIRQQAIYPIRWKIFLNTLRLVYTYLIRTIIFPFWIIQDGWTHSRDPHTKYSVISLSNVSYQLVINQGTECGQEVIEPEAGDGWSQGWMVCLHASSNSTHRWTAFINLGRLESIAYIVDHLYCNLAPLHCSHCNRLQLRQMAAKLSWQNALTNSQTCYQEIRNKHVYLIGSFTIIYLQ